MHNMKLQSGLVKRDKLCCYDIVVKEETFKLVFSNCVDFACTM